MDEKILKQIRPYLKESHASNVLIHRLSVPER